ncbi:MAG: SIMPL domain-containing protein, partial [Acidobacteria bacterium]|nr:SIMPL domain-containing protein [Acidobacteriota bacterium]
GPLFLGADGLGVAATFVPSKQGKLGGFDITLGLETPTGYAAALSGPITGYHLKQSLEIRSTEIDKITAVSRQVTELINQGILLESEEPQYLYTKLAQTKVEILADAAKDAMARAQQIAASTGSRVGEVCSADMGVLQITAADSNEVSGYGMNDTKSLEKDITAVVHITFALQ